MDFNLVFATGFAPGIFWLWYFYKKDVLEQEPKARIIKTFVLGMAAVIPASLLEVPFPKPWVAIIVAPIVEECAKFLVVRMSVYKCSDFNEPVDGIVYAATAALGFASLENAGYLLSVYSASERDHYTLPLATFEATFAVFMVRAVLSVPGHVLWSSLWGHELGKCKFQAQGAYTAGVAKGLLFAIVCHGAFNLFVSIPGLWWGAVLLTIYNWRLVRKRLAADIAASPFLSTAKQAVKKTEA
jgi:RsiW-degrading membrane proteinase PrsW (M82 family)